MIYHHDLDPFLLGPWQVGPFENFGIRWYSLAYIVGFIWLYYALYKAAVRRQIPNGGLERLEEASLLLIASVIVGGRLGYFILNEPEKLTTLQGWLEVPQVWHGGMAFFGAALAIFVAPYIYCRRNRIGFWHAADRVMYVFAFALGFGRVANFINAELIGLPTGGNWGVIFPTAPLIDGVNVPRHPAQLYEAVSHWLLGALLICLLKARPRTTFQRMPGYHVFVFLVVYGLLRFLTDFWRYEPEHSYGPLNGSQLMSLLFLLIGIVTGIVRYKVFSKYAAEEDWYPPEGAAGELPDSAHAFLDEQIAKAEAEKAAKDEAKKTGKKDKSRARPEEPRTK